MPDVFSPMLKDLLSKLLDKDPTKRPTGVEILEHPWFNPDVLDQIVID